ncbi:MAG: ferritin-like domain-containing protein [Bryobacteraceae bacterium]
MLEDLLADHETIIRVLRTDVEACTDTYHDAGTADFLTGLMEGHEKMAWMIRAFLH